MTTLSGLSLLAAVSLAVLPAGAGALAQGRSQPAPQQQGAMQQGLSKNRDKPVHIEAATLEVRDRDRMATFSGNVQVVQGDTTMRCRVLVVHYDNEASGGAKPAKPGPGGGSQQISRLEAKGNVVVVQQDQTATGDNGLFDMKSNTITLTGNVTVSQGGNVVRGERLVVDMTTGVSKIDAGPQRGPVRMLIEPGKDGAGPTMKPSLTR